MENLLPFYPLWLCPLRSGVAHPLHSRKASVDDRGAKICHRVAVDNHHFPSLDIVGTVLIDIVPTKVQWEAFANPTIAVGYFHCQSFANLAVAVPMLEAYSGGCWC